MGIVSCLFKQDLEELNLPYRFCHTCISDGAPRIGIAANTPFKVYSKL